MKYIEVKLNIVPFSPWSDLISDELGQIGFESFMEEDGFLLAYCEEDSFSEKALKAVDTLNNPDVSVSYEFKNLAQENWNKEWESNFQPVYVDNDICVRATFHEKDESYKYDIVIDPKMSFGTGHHATTHLILSGMRHVDFKGKSVLDMGSGTGVLAIFAAMKGAKPVYAIDIDEWCSINAMENAERNKVDHIKISQGGKEAIGDLKVDIILANINRNILLDQFEEYSNALNVKGQLFISGFYTADVEVLVEKAENLGFSYVGQNSMNDWTTVSFTKK